MNHLSRLGKPVSDKKGKKILSKIIHTKKARYLIRKSKYIAIYLNGNENYRTTHCHLVPKILTSSINNTFILNCVNLKIKKLTIKELLSLQGYEHVNIDHRLKWNDTIGNIIPKPIFKKIIDQYQSKKTFIRNTKVGIIGAVGIEGLALKNVLYCFSVNSSNNTKNIQENNEPPIKILTINQLENASEVDILFIKPKCNSYISSIGKNCSKIKQMSDKKNSENSIEKTVNYILKKKPKEVRLEISIPYTQKKFGKKARYYRKLFKIIEGKYHLSWKKYNLFDDFRIIHNRSSILLNYRIKN